MSSGLDSAELRLPQRVSRKRHASLCSVSWHRKNTPSAARKPMRSMAPSCRVLETPETSSPFCPQMDSVRRAGLSASRSSSPALLFRHVRCMWRDAPPRRRDISSTAAKVFLVTAGDAVESLFAGFTSFHAGTLLGDRLLFDGGLKFKAASRVLLRQTGFCQQHTRQRIVNTNTLWDAAVCMLSSWWLQF